MLNPGKWKLSESDTLVVPKVNSGSGYLLAHPEFIMTIESGSILPYMFSWSGKQC